MRVLKFGGTSVGKPERMRQVSELITRDDEAKIVVLSAVSGTTNSLVQIGDSLYKKEKSDALTKIKDLYTHYEAFVDELYQADNFKAEGLKIVDKQFAIIREMLDNDFTDKEERELLAQGELISTQLFAQFLKENNIEGELLWALDFMSIDEHFEPELNAISGKLKPLIEAKPNNKIFITQGFICRNTKGEIDNLKRGGSDYTASLIGAAINANVVEIWTDIDGMHNNDPRIVDKTAPIAELSFDEAAELAYFGAKILHPSTIRPAQDHNIPVKLLNTMDPDALGTTISSKIDTENIRIKALAGKDNITAIKIKSSRMLLAYGFLRQVFEVFEKYRTPIDMITTSEVAVSLTIDNDLHLKSIVKELQEFGIVEIDTDQAIVCCVGSLIAEKKGIPTLVLQCLQNIPIRMLSFGGSKNNISLLINAEDKNKALQQLNEGIFNF